MLRLSSDLIRIKNIHLVFLVITDSQTTRLSVSSDSTYLISVHPPLRQTNRHLVGCCDSLFYSVTDWTVSFGQTVSPFDIQFVSYQVMQTDIDVITAIQCTHTLSVIANSVSTFLLFQCKYHVDVEIDIKWALPISVQLPVTLRSPRNQSVSKCSLFSLA